MRNPKRKRKERNLTLKINWYIIRTTFFFIVFSQAFIIVQMTSITASTETAVKVEPHENTAKVNDTFTINITIVDIQNLFGLEITLEWDASILRMAHVDARLGVESYPEGVLHEPLYNQTVLKEGKYQLIATSIGRETPSFNGSGNIARITFYVANPGSCTLNLKAKLASKPLPGKVALPITHTTIDGYFYTQEPEQTIWPHTTTLIAVIMIATVVTAMTIYYKRRKRPKMMMDKLESRRA
jgi:hypothetical protein